MTKIILGKKNFWVISNKKKIKQDIEMMRGWFEEMIEEVRG